MDDTPERYRDTPMLIVVENYALAVIGLLDSDKEASMRQIVKTTFGGDDDWRATVRATLQWTSSIDDEIRVNWEEFNRAATAQGVPIDPVAFVQAFGDAISK